MSEMEQEQFEEQEVETPELEDAPPQEETWSLSRDEWEGVQQYINASAPLMNAIAERWEQEQQYQQQQQYQQPQYGQPAPQGLPEEFDPFEPSSVQAYIDAHVQQGVQQGVQQALGGYQPLLNMVASREGEAMARQELDRIKSDVGAFDEDAAMLIANTLISEGKDPSIALRTGAQYVRELEQKIRQQEREAYQKELQGLSKAPAESPVGSLSAQEMERVPTGPRRYEEAMARAAARRRAGNPLG